MASNETTPPYIVHWRDKRLITIACNGGFLNAALGDESLYVTDLFVDPNQRRRGLGTTMLRGAMEVAQNANVNRVVADITSQPSLDAMRRVFGADSVAVFAEGGYEVDGGWGDRPTVAQLSYILPTQREL